MRFESPFELSIEWNSVSGFKVAEVLPVSSDSARDSVLKTPIWLFNVLVNAVNRSDSLKPSKVAFKFGSSSFGRFEIVARSLVPLAASTI